MSSRQLKCAIGAAIAAVSTFIAAASAGTITTERVATGLQQPVYVTAPPGSVDLLFILEQYTGRVRVLDLITGEIRPTPFPPRHAAFRGEVSRIVLPALR